MTTNNDPEEKKRVSGSGVVVLENPHVILS